jgi:hypothetical protein
MLWWNLMLLKFDDYQIRRRAVKTGQSRDTHTQDLLTGGIIGGVLPGAQRSCARTRESGDAKKKLLRRKRNQELQREVESKITGQEVPSPIGIV